MSTTPNFGALLFETRARELAGNFREFAEAAWHVLEPTTTLVPSRNLEIIGEYLSAVTAGQIRKLIINCPPRTGKSTWATIMWPCWAWACDDATSRWMMASYSASLSTKHSLDRRTLLTSDWFRKLWPKVELAEGQNEKAQFASTNRGHQISTSVNATATGKGAGVILLDDPHSASQALSDADRKTAITWFRQTLSTRLDDPRTGSMVLVSQRLNSGDLSGELLHDGGWEHLSLPAVCERRTIITLPISGREIIREVGDLLEPQRLSQRTLDNFKLQMGSLAFAGQYQQQPVPLDGGIFKRAWWKRFSIVPATATFIVQSWDLGFRKTEDSDFVVGQTWAFDGQLAYLVDQVRGRLSYTETKAAIRAMSLKWKNTSAVLVEAKANGDAVLDELKREIPGIIGIEPEGGKQARAHAMSPQVEAGQVFLPEFAPWVEDFLLELSLFPAGSNDDCVDAASQCLLWRRTHGYGGVYSKALVVSNDNTNSVIYDAAAHPEWSSDAWYASRTVVVIPGIAKAGCILEVLDRGCYEPYTVSRCLVFNDSSGNFSLSHDELFAELKTYTHKQNMGNGRWEFNSNILLPDSAEAAELKNECMQRGYWFQSIELEPDEILGMVARVGMLFDRRKVRVSSDCVQFLQQHREFRYDTQKSRKTGEEQIIEDGRHPAVEAFRLFASKLNQWSLR